MSRQVLRAEESQTFTPLVDATEDKTRRATSCDYIRRYDNPAADTAFPLEYAFHLLGDFRQKKVVDLGCGEGSNAAMLTSLGANVISIDSNVATIPVDDGVADRVLCAHPLLHFDVLSTARQIRRMLKPGGSAVFVARVAGADWIRRIKMVLPISEYLPHDQRVLTPQEIEAASRAVGRPGRRREFMLTSQLLEHIGVRSALTIEKSYQVDAWILNRFAFARAFASTWVWEACKER
jgi:SAM-dependent methyltransferase